jgi:hypothetical protein
MIEENRRRKSFRTNARRSTRGPPSFAADAINVDDAEHAAALKLRCAVARNECATIRCGSHVRDGAAAVLQPGLSLTFHKGRAHLRASTRL